MRIRILSKSLPQAQEGWVQRAANANLNFWEKCGLASNANNGGGGGGPWGGGGYKSDKYKSIYEEMSDINAYDKDERKSFKSTLPQGVDIKDWVAFNRDASRLNAKLGDTRMDKFTDSTGTLKPEYQNIATQFDPYFLYYKPAFMGKKSVTPNDIMDYHMNQPHGISGFKDLANRSYMPAKQNGGEPWHSNWNEEEDQTEQPVDTKISMPSLALNTSEPSREEAPKDYFNQKAPVQQSLSNQVQSSGIAPSFKTDAIDDLYNNDSNAAKSYDNSLYNYHSQNPLKKDSRDYFKWYNNKYDDKKKNNNLGNQLAFGISLLDNIITPFDQAKKQKEWNRSFMNRQFNTAPNAGNDRGDNDILNGIYQPDKLPAVNKGRYTNQFSSMQSFADGGTQIDNEMDKIKIRIVSGPEQMAYGGQSGYGLNLGQKNMSNSMNKSRYDSVGSTMQPVSRNMANIEAEKGETVYGDIDGDGALEHMNIGGKRHNKGGTPLYVPEGSFIFSDTKKMTIKDDSILKQFGLSARASGYTPAKIAKRYDLNKYKAIMEDPNADSINKQTAQLMVKKYNEKLGLLSLVQESMKGFPQGKPQVAMQQEDQFKVQYGGYLPRAQYAGELPMFDPGTMYGNYNASQYGATPGPGVNPNTGKRKSTIVVQSNDGKKPPIVISEDDIFNQSVIDDLKNKGYNINFSPRIAKGDTKVPVMQRKQSSGLYGDVQMNEIEELKSRHPWYFENKTNWNPANKADVLDFQTRYDAEFANQKGYSYFDGKKVFSEKDEKLGEYTYNAPGLDMSPKKEQPKGGWVCTDNGVKYVGPNDPLSGYEMYGFYDTQAEAEAVCPKKEIPEPIVPGKNDFTGNQKLPFDYMTPDVVNMFASAAIPPKKRLPFIADTPFEPGNLALEDWRSKAAARYSQFNNAANTMGTYGPSSALASNLSFLSGQTAEGIGQDIAQVESRNTDRANEFNSREQMRKDQNNFMRSANATERWKGNVIANEQYDNANRKYLNNMAKTYGTAFNNRMNLGLTNAVNPMYNIDPRSGRSFFKEGYSTNKLGMVGSGQMNWADLQKDYTIAKGSTDLSFAKYLELRGFGKTTSIDKDGDGSIDSRRTVQRNGGSIYSFLKDGYNTYPQR